MEGASKKSVELLSEKGLASESCKAHGRSSLGANGRSGASNGRGGYDVEAQGKMGSSSMT
jgi:hypothetical protein